MSRLLCPYCRSEIVAISKDHIFPDFLGGTRTVPACAKCNNSFGSTFESKAARQLLSFQLMLRSLGISKIPIKDGARWRRSYEHNGELHDIEFRDGKVVVVRSQPKVVRDPDGRVVSVSVRSIEEAKSLRRRPELWEEVEIKGSSTPIRIDEHNFAFEFGPDFGRLIIKMCVALASTLPDFDPADVHESAQLLGGSETSIDDVRRDYGPLDHLDGHTPLLSHTIYLERQARVLHGRVTLFGAIRMYCRLRGGLPTGQNRAIRGTLNVLNGEETFDEISPLGLSAAPLVVLTQTAETGMAIWAAQLRRQIAEAGQSGWNVALGTTRNRPDPQANSLTTFSKPSTSSSTVFSVDLPTRNEAD